LPGRPSVGQAVFFTTTKPTQDITIASGSVVSTDADPDNNLPAVTTGPYIIELGEVTAEDNDVSIENQAGAVTDGNGYTWKAAGEEGRASTLRKAEAFVNLALAGPDEDPEQG
jgi:hypothetical protein